MTKFIGCKYNFLFFWLFFLGSCAFNPNLNEYMYLRGAFSWWEAKEEFRFKKITKELYFVEVKLIADGKAYDFKFADAKWGKTSNCGYFDESHAIVKERKKYRANCSSLFNNFSFTPKTSGIYYFYFDRSEKVPTIYIEKAQE